MKLASRILLSLHKRLRLASFNFEALLSFMPQAGKALDVGCGFGLWLNLLSQRRPKLKTWGFDPNKRKLLEARKLLMRPIDKWPKNQRFNVITIFDVLYLVPEKTRMKFIKDAYTKLHSGGRLLLAFVPKENTWRYYLAWLQELAMVKKVTDFETVKWMRQTLKQVGFKKISLHLLPTPWPWWHKHLLVVAIK